MLTGILVSRLLSLPRREWPPRPDEEARVVPVPGEPSAYLLMPSFAAAEALRTAWCATPATTTRTPADRPPDLA